MINSLKSLAKRLLAITKTDFIDAQLQQELEEELPELPHVFISAVSGTGISELKDMLWSALEASILER